MERKNNTLAWAIIGCTVWLTIWSLGVNLFVYYTEGYWTDEYDIQTTYDEMVMWRWNPNMEEPEVMRVISQDEISRRLEQARSELRTRSGDQ